MNLNWFECAKIGEIFGQKLVNVTSVEIGFDGGNVELGKDTLRLMS